MLFSACAFPVHIWAILNLLRELPAWLLRLSAWELIGVVAYALAFAFIESLLFFLVLVLLAAVLPPKLFRDRLVATGTMIVTVTSVWAAAAHYNSEAIRLWGLRNFGLWGGLYAASILGGWILVYRAERVEGTLVAVADRLAVLAGLYCVVDVAAIAIVFVRNVAGALA
jgi:hypothetical protein